MFSSYHPSDFPTCSSEEMSSYILKSLCLIRTEHQQVSETPSCRTAATIRMVTSGDEKLCKNFMSYAEIEPTTSPFVPSAPQVAISGITDIYLLPRNPAGLGIEQITHKIHPTL